MPINWLTIFFFLFFLRKYCLGFLSRRFLKDYQNSLNFLSFLNETKLFPTYFVESKQAGQKFSTPFHISIPEITFSQTSAATNFKSFLLRMEISACFLARFFSFLCFLWTSWVREIEFLKQKTQETCEKYCTWQSRVAGCWQKGFNQAMPRHVLLLPPIPAKRFIAWNSAQREWLAQRVVWQECESGTWPLWQVPKKPSDTERQREKESCRLRLGMGVQVRASDSVGRQRICKMLQENFALSKGIKNLQQQHQQKSQKTLTTNANAKFYRPYPPLSHFSILFCTQALLLLGENQLQVTQKHQNCIKCQHITTSRGNNSDNNNSSNSSGQMEARKSL